MTVAASRRRDRQVVRILGILGTLLEGSQPSIRQLAGRYGTRRETIYRDMRALEEAGYPIVGDEQGRLSHPRLLAEARRYAPHLRLSDSEIAALLWASRLAKTSSPFRSALASAGTKLRAMGTSVQADLAAGIEAAVGEGGFGAKDYEPHKETVFRLVEAIVRRRRCDLRYWSPANAATKSYEFDPYRLLTVSGALYCLGRVPPYENVTTLAVDRIQTLDMTDANFVVDPGFDADRYQRESFGVIWEKPMNVVIRFSADQAPYIRERVWHSTQRIRELRDGRVELSFRAGGAFEIARWVMGWGDTAEVIRPARLRIHVAQILKSATQAYGRTGRQ